MNIVILGPQASGKGTQAELLANRFGFNHYEAGKILRSIAKSDNKYAPAINEAMTKGELVSDELVRLIAWDYINKKGGKNGFVFDGYPRSVPQYDHLSDMLMKFGLRIDLVVNLSIPKPETLRRLSGRRTCTVCGEVYNLVTNPPPSPTTCKCGGDLFIRDDDREEAILERLRLYESNTYPVFLKALEGGVGVLVDGSRPIEEIQEDLAGLVLRKQAEINRR